MPGLEYSLDSEELLVAFNGCIIKYGLSVKIDPTEFVISSPAAVDVEHDEQGNMVGIGVYDGITSCYFTNISSSLSDRLSTLSIIAHNGRTDFECLRHWGIHVTDDQLFWDTELITHILDSSRKGYGLKKLAEDDLSIVYPSYADIVGKRTLKQVKERKTLDKHPVELVALY